MPFKDQVTVLLGRSYCRFLNTEFCDMFMPVSDPKSVITFLNLTNCLSINRHQLKLRTIM